MQTSAMIILNAPYIPIKAPINKKTIPKMHVQKVMQQPPTSLAIVPTLSSLGPPRGGGGILGVSISANNNPHWMAGAIVYNC